MNKGDKLKIKKWHTLNANSFLNLFISFVEGSTLTVG